MIWEIEEGTGKKIQISCSYPHSWYIHIITRKKSRTVDDPDNETKILNRIKGNATT